jgi:hypothetical protein
VADIFNGNVSDQFDPRPTAEVEMPICLIAKYARSRVRVSVVCCQAM